MAFIIGIYHDARSSECQMHFGFMRIILLYSDHRHVSTTHVTIFRVVSARIQIYI